MAQLVFAAMCSLDGYVNDASGSFDWAMPDGELHQHFNDLERGVGTYLYGRRMYEVMSYWETVGTGEEVSAVERDYAHVWQDTDKVVYSSTLDAVTTARTRLERTFDPDAVRELKAAAGRDLAIGGPTLAGHALAAGLVDEVQLYLVPVVVGGGTRVLPDDVRLDLKLVEQRQFGTGVVQLSYRPR